MERQAIDSSEWDFSYLAEHEHLKRCAVLYEYGRQNSYLKEWIIELRKFGMFANSKDYLSADQSVRDKINKRMSREIDIISFVEVQFLLSLEAFPTKPFSETLSHLDLHLCEHVNGGAISNPPTGIREIPDGVWHRTHNPPSTSNQPVSSEQSTHIFSIPWRGTSNDELASQFRAWLDAHRPQQFPSGGKRGRNSGSSNGANHKLTQLGAYRLHDAGFSREEAQLAGFSYYTREQDWNRAITEADARIKQLYRPVAE